MKINTKKYIENNLVIKTKNSKLSNLKFNQAQQIIYDVIKKQDQLGKPKRILILKARQLGASTLIGGMMFKMTATDFNVNSSVIAHDIESTNKLFEMHKLFYEKLPNELKPSIKSNNAKILEFDKEDGSGLKSHIRCMTAGTKGVGRGGTIHNLHISEFAFWSGDKWETLNSIMQSVPNTLNTFVAIESTANGYNEFQQMWQMAVNGENDFEPVFIPWYVLDDYRLKQDIVLTDEEKLLAERFSLDNDQIAWRRWCIKNNCGGDVNKFKQEYPSTPEEAFISTGECYFDTEKIIGRTNVVTMPIVRGYFEYKKEVIDAYGQIRLRDVQFIESPNGLISIYKHPLKDGMYVIGGDTAGEGKDAYTGQVIDNNSLEQVAEFRSVNCSEDYYAEQMACLGWHYNNALLSIEANYNPYIIKLVSNVGYENMYIREGSNDAMYNKYTDKYGFKTTSITRPAILSEFRIIFNEKPELINSKALLGEMQTFMVSSGGRPEALNNSHDDLVMAMAIAYGTRHQQGIKRTGTARVGSLLY